MKILFVVHVNSNDSKKSIADKIVLIHVALNTQYEFVHVLQDEHKQRHLLALFEPFVYA